MSQAGLSGPTLDPEKIYLFEEMPVRKASLKLAMPTVLGQLILVAYNMADTFFVSRTGDESQVAALTICFPVFMLLVAISNLFGIGANSLISRSLGVKDYPTARRAASWGVFSGTAAAGVFVLALLAFQYPLCRLMGASGTSMAHTLAYLRWAVIIGGVPTVLQLILAHCARAIGEARKASVSMAACGVLNIVLDPILIFTFGMGVKGAAIATALSNALAAGYLAAVIWGGKKSALIAPSFASYRPFVKMGGEILLVGLTPALMGILASAANMIIAHITALYGDLVVASFGVMQKLGTITIQLTVGFSQGMTPLVGYNYAARSVKRVTATCRFGFTVLAVFTAAFIIFTELFAQWETGLFLKDPQAVEMSAAFLRRWITCVPGLCFVQMQTASMQAMGKWRRSLIVSLLRLLVFYIPMIFVTHRLFGLYGMFFAQPIGETATLAVSTAMFVSLMRRLKGSAAPAPPA